MSSIPLSPVTNNNIPDFIGGPAPYIPPPPLQDVTYCTGYSKRENGQLIVVHNPGCPGYTAVDGTGQEHYTTLC